MHSYITLTLLLQTYQLFNPNAIYELGVRHALRPYSTIIIKEDEGKYRLILDTIE